MTIEGPDSFLKMFLNQLHGDLEFFLWFFRLGSCMEGLSSWYLFLPHSSFWFWFSYHWSWFAYYHISMNKPIQFCKGLFRELLLRSFRPYFRVSSWCSFLFCSHGLGILYGNENRLVAAMVPVRGRESWPHSWVDGGNIHCDAKERWGRDLDIQRREKKYEKVLM